MTEFILIRHGETDWNRELRFQGQVDVPLNATGHAQAARVAQRLAAEHVDHVVCSDLIRTRQTAAPVLQQCLPQFTPDAVADAALREQSFGLVDGLRVDEIKTRFAAAWAQWVRFEPDGGMPGGETTRAFHARVMGALQGLAAHHPHRTLVVVTHGGVLDIVYRTALGLGLAGPRRAEIPNGGFNRVRFTPQGIEIVVWGDTRHLEGLPAQPRYDEQRVAASPMPRSDATEVASGVAPGNAAL